MPTILKIGRYVIYFWSNENDPREPIHVHVSVRRASPNATKLWITKDRKVIIDNNNSKIPEHDLKSIAETIEKDIDIVLEAWRYYFGEIKYFC